MTGKSLYSNHCEGLYQDMLDNGINPNCYACLATPLPQDDNFRQNIPSGWLYTIHMIGDTEHFGHGYDIESAFDDLLSQIPELS